ncbi:MAG: efflux RND transporter periplasmic adaptor subunit [Sedimentisphaerales bacterium]|jgi:HlyD family secretion protein
MNENKANNLPKTTSKPAWWRSKWFIATGLVIVIIAVLIMTMAANKTSTPAPSKALSTFLARRDNLTVTVTESGSIKARKSIDLKSEVEGRATIINIVPEGSYVTPEDVCNGKILVELDSGDLREQQTQRQIDFTTEDASYAQAKEAYDIQVKQNESDITAAELKVRFALMDFQKYLGETLANHIIDAIKEANDPNVDTSAIIDVDNFIQDTNKLGGQGSQDIDGWKDKIKLAAANLANAKYQLEGTQELFDANYVAKIELDRDALSRDSYEIQEEEAIVSLNLYKLYDFPKQVQTFLSAYFESKRNLERTYAKARSQLAQAKAQLESAKARLDLQADRLEKSKKQLAACVIKAPAPGLVVYGSSMDTMSRYRGAGLIAPGETVYQRQTIITLPDTSSMMAEIDVHESSVDKIKLGQKATIVMDAFPDQTFNGEVIKIASLPDQQRNWLSPDIKVYTTQVSIEGTHSFLKPGMSARVEIFVDYAPNALVVPVQVVANRSGKKVCFTVNGGKSIEKEVKTGLFNDTWVQILEGLNEGEEVMLNPPRINETKKESEKQLADKFPKNGQQPQPVLAQATDDQSQTSEPNRAGRRRQGMPMGMTGPQGMPPGPMGELPDFNKLDDATKEKIKQFRERAAKGEMPDLNQMDERSREKFKQSQNRMRQQSDGQTTSQEP